MHTKFLWESLKGKHHSEDLGVDGRRTLKWKLGWSVSCEHDNETSGSINSREYFYYSTSFSIRPVPLTLSLASYTLMFCFGVVPLTQTKYPTLPKSDINAFNIIAGWHGGGFRFSMGPKP
jgi:hypothetical protein